MRSIGRRESASDCAQDNTQFGRKAQAVAVNPAVRHRSGRHSSIRCKPALVVSGVRALKRDGDRATHPVLKPFFIQLPGAH